MTTPEPKTELMPCPFCGGKPLWCDMHPRENQQHIECEDCGLSFSFDDEKDKDYRDFIARWNTRAPVDTASHESGVESEAINLCDQILDAMDDLKTDQALLPRTTIEIIASRLVILEAALSQSAPKAGQVDVEALKQKVRMAVTSPVGIVHERSELIDVIIDHLSTQGYFDKPIAGLREKVKSLQGKLRAPQEYTHGYSSGYLSGSSDTIDAVIELIDRGA